MGEIFNTLIRGLGSILGFFYDLLDGVLSEGVALGVAIILLTIVVNILVFPLTLKQTRATRAFTAIQPEIKRIQKEYKDDPQEMQKKLMELQKSAGATPGGCLLPLLVQMPIWFALFRLLQTPEQYIAPESALGLALADDVPKTFLGMDLFTSPSRGDRGRRGGGSSLSDHDRAHGGHAVRPAMACHLWTGTPRWSAGGRRSAGDHQDHAALHRFHLLELPCRPNHLLGDGKPVPTWPAGPDLQDGRTPDAGGHDDRGAQERTEGNPGVGRGRGEETPTGRRRQAPTAQEEVT